MHSANGIIYVVDDDAFVRESTMALLQAAGLSALAFESGGEFLNKLDSAGGGCILLDLHMPGLSGFQVLDTLNRNGNRKPVILFSGRVDSTTEEFAKASGAAALLPKPSPPGQLIALLRQLLSQDRTGR
jgi:two-component system, LuxR family, response regulator FixJ